MTTFKKINKNSELVRNMLKKRRKFGNSCKIKSRKCDWGKVHFWMERGSWKH